MTAKERLVQVKAKMEEVTKRIDVLKTGAKDGSISENTMRTQTFKLRHDLKMMGIIKALLSGEEVNDEDFTSVFTLTKEREAGTVEVHKGDKLMELLVKYADKKDIMNKIAKAAEKQGLVVNMATGIVE